MHQFLFAYKLIISNNWQSRDMQETSIFSIVAMGRKSKTCVNIFNYFNYLIKTNDDYR